MKFFIDNQEYELPLSTIANRLEEKYLLLKDKPLKMPNGKTFDFSRKSLLRTALKSALVPIVLPILQGMYEENFLILPPHEKHSDLIDYLIIHALRFIGLMEGKINLNVTTSEDNDSCIKHVTSVSTIRKTAINAEKLE
jgi:hypothetical protein